MSDDESPAAEERILGMVSDALDEQPGDEPIRPVWPSVRDRLKRERRPVLRSMFGAAAAAALLVGVGIGLFIGSSAKPAQESGSSSLWSAVGSSLAEDGGGSLSGTWSRMMSGEGVGR